MTKVMKAFEPEGQHGARRVDEDDVEGHSLLKAIEPEGQHGARRVDEDDDTEGHSMTSQVIGREVARARELEIQRNLRAHAARQDASRPHKK
jgi:hypothetical protein